MVLPDSVMKKIRADFAPQRCPAVETLLSTYGSESCHGEDERVLLDILSLARGNEKEVAELVERAKRDYRDIILWAEYTEESRLDDPEKVRRFNEMLEKFGVKFRVQGAEGSDK